MPTNKRDVATVIAKLERTRDDLLREVAGLAASDAMRGTEWSVLDAVRHLMPATGGYHRFIRRMVEEDNPVFPTFPSPEELWTRQVEAVSKMIDDTTEYAQSLSEGQLGKTALRRGQTVTVIDMLGVMADHIAEHTKQIREEIRPRLGL